jgi:hypothetical protein
MRENLTSGLTRGAGASLPLLYLFRLAAGKLHANYGSELKRLLYAPKFEDNEIPCDLPYFNFQ